MAQKISTYRDLSEMEVELINELKHHEAMYLHSIQKVRGMRQAQKDFIEDGNVEADGLTVEQINESMRCMAIATTNIETGAMWAVRGVALPTKLEVEE